MWFFAGDNAIAEDHEFAQFYINTRRIYSMGQRWKFLLRAELGYSKAEVDTLELNTTEGDVELSITRLPNFYRFKAGGSQSVRGYGFESLSDNDIGSNNILTASAEVEFQVLTNWSAAAFFDIGNAFNDWDQVELRKGVGVGIRWYSIAGPIRVDVAKALDIEGKPWRLHFTIGTPLL
jgi:translocation and assembly module TamA